MSASFEQLEKECREALQTYEKHLKSYPINAATAGLWIEWAARADKLRQQAFDADMRLIMAHFRGVAVK